MKFISKLLIAIAACALTCGTVTSCKDDQSYADLLKEESQSVNRFLANQRVVDAIPADTVFQVGQNAPYYQLDEDGTVFMQVISLGTDEKPSAGDRVYFRFTRFNLNYYKEGETMTGSGNADNVSPDAVGPTYFVFDDYYNTNSIQWGTGIQLPMRYLGYEAKVNVIIKSRSGMMQEQTSVVPYLYSVTYYKPLI